MTIPQDQTVPTETWFDFIVEHRLASNSQDQILKKLEQFVICGWYLDASSRRTLPQSKPASIGTSRTRWQTSTVCGVDGQRSTPEPDQGPGGTGYAYSARTDWRGFGAWVSTDRTEDQPPAWKLNLLVLLCLYPTVLILNSLINPLGWGYSSAILIGNICSVALTGWILVPGAQKMYSDWFNGRLPPRRGKLALLSILALILLIWSISQTLSG